MSNYELLEKLLLNPGFVAIIIVLLICVFFAMPIAAMVFNYSYSSKVNLMDGSLDLTLSPSKKEDRQPDKERHHDAENDKPNEIN